MYLCWSIVQFTYNPEWFQDEDDEEEEWDLAQYRQQQEDEDLAAEEQRVHDLTLDDTPRASEQDEGGD